MGGEGGGGGVRYSEKVKIRGSDAGGFIKKQLVNKFSLFFFLSYTADQSIDS